jgi:hypothetical protein
VAVVVVESAEGQGGASITVPFLSAKVGGGAMSSTEAASRVKFKVPIALPHDATAFATYEKRVADAKAEARELAPGGRHFPR